MILEPLSGPSENVREGVERGKLRTGVSSTAAVTGKRKRDGEDEGGENAGKTEKKKKEKGGKKVSGPNPLSMKKPKTKKVKTAAAEGGESGVKGAKADNTTIAAEKGKSEEQVEQGEGIVKTKRKRRHKSSKQDGDNRALDYGDAPAVEVES